jgi:hypothetical protein
MGGSALASAAPLLSDGGVGAVWFIARSGATRRALPGLLLAALVGLAGAAILTAWAGARRTDSAYERLSESVNHADLVVTAEGDPFTFDPAVASGGAGVASTGVVKGFGAVRVFPDGTLDFETSTALLGPADTTAWYDLDRPLLAEGRIPAPDATDELMVPEDMRDRGFPVGSGHAFCVVDFGEALAFGQGVLEGTATSAQQQAFVEQVCEIHRLRVVGVTRPGPDEVVLREDSEADLFPQISPGLVAAIGKPEVFSFVLVDLQDGTDQGAYVDAVLDSAAPDAGVSVQSASLRASVVDRTVEPYVRALGLFAIVAALAAVGVLGPSVLRWAGTPEGDRAPLLALGMRPYQLRLASALRGAAIGIVGAVVAIVIAVLASPRFPIGLAARLEPHPGLRVDGAVLAIGALAMVVLSATLGTIAPARERRTMRRPSQIAEALQVVGARPAPLAGVRAALAGDGRGASAARTAGGIAVAIVAIVTALTFQRGLGRVLDTPARYGWTWDVALELGDGEIPVEMQDALAAEPAVEGLSIGRRTALLRDGAAVQTFSFVPRTGDTYPLIVEGRRPQGNREIALGAQTMKRLDVSLGDQLAFRTPAGQLADLTVVGQTLLPLLSYGQDLSVAEGGLVDDTLLEPFTEGPPSAIALVDLAEGADADELVATLEATSDGPPVGFGFAGPTYTADLRGYDAVRGTPVLLASILAVLGVGVLVQTIAASARGRRRELAVLRCLGFVGRELRATVRWNAMTLVGICLAVSVPIGIAVGRALWSSFARDIGLVADPITPVGGVVTVIVATLAATLLLVAVVGRQATRLNPAEALRTE